MLGALKSRANIAGGVLVADVPAPNNPCRMWRVYAGSSAEGGRRREALETLTDMGLAKYDEDHSGTDSGVLSIRDWLLAVESRAYVTCHGDSVSSQCAKCFRANSKFIRRILEAREKSGRPSFRDWFAVKSDDVVAAATIVTG